MDADLDGLAKMFTYLIEKYADKLDLEDLPDPPRPTANEAVGFILWHFACILVRKKL